MIDKLLENIQGASVEMDKDLSKFSTMRLQAKGDLVTVESVEALQEVQKRFYSESLDFIVIGMGANQLLKKESAIPYLMLKFPFDKKILESVHDTYTLPASVRLGTLTSHASKFGLKGWEVFTGVPASLGGAVFMNAGTGLGEIGELVSKVWTVKSNGELSEHSINNSSFSYRRNNFLERGEIIYQVEMKHNGLDKEVTEVIRNYLARRNATQPMKEKTCGCVFKNSEFKGQPCPAGKFVDILGIKGLQVGGIRVSETHGNFMENFDNASFDDVTALISIVQNEMKLQFGLDFELEVKAK